MPQQIYKFLKKFIKILLELLFFILSYILRNENYFIIVKGLFLSI